MVLYCVAQSYICTRFENVLLNLDSRSLRQVTILHYLFMNIVAVNLSVPITLHICAPCNEPFLDAGLFPFSCIALTFPYFWDIIWAIYSALKLWPMFPAAEHWHPMPGFTSYTAASRNYSLPHGVLLRKLSRKRTAAEIIKIWSGSATYSIVCYLWL